MSLEKAQRGAPIIWHIFISLNNISNMLRYLYETPPHNNWKFGCALQCPLKGKAPLYDQDVCFSIEYYEGPKRTTTKTLDLAATSKYDRDVWVRGLQRLSNEPGAKECMGHERSAWIEELFNGLAKHALFDCVVAEDVVRTLVACTGASEAFVQLQVDRVCWQDTDVAGGLDSSYEEDGSVSCTPAVGVAVARESGALQVNSDQFAEVYTAITVRHELFFLLREYGAAEDGILQADQLRTLLEAEQVSQPQIT